VNWFRFKVELVALVVKVLLATATTVVMGRMFFAPEGIRDYAVYLRPVAERQDWIFPLVFTTGFAILWVCYWRVIRVYRGYRRYKGEQ
jgi:hypothetical protein